jgi:hypothetical protein
VIEIIISILVGFFMFLGVSQSASVPPDIDRPPVVEETPITDEPTFESLTNIEDVQGIVLTSFPAQLVLQISGAQPDGCDYPVTVTQTREGNTVTVRIYRVMPLAAMCPMMLVTYNESIKLDGSFEPGTYTIHVNDYTLEVTV